MLKQNMLLILGYQLFYAVIVISYGKEYYKVFKISAFSSDFKRGGKIEKFKPT